MNIIEIKNLKKYFKEVKAVDDISFTVKQGQLFAFLGLNGAGKSTTIKIICNTLEKDSGTIIIDGHDIDNGFDDIKPMLGIVFQNSILDKVLTVKQNLKIRASLYGIDGSVFEERLENLARLLEFDDILNRPLAKLSGGQRRRIDIARALICNPKILILDEPTTGLDPKSRAIVWGVLNSLRKTQNLTIFLTTHYMEETTDADYVVILDSGKVVANGSPNVLKNKYANDYIRIYNPTQKIVKEFEKQNLKFLQEKEFIEIEIKDTKVAKDLITQYPDCFDDFEVVKGKMDSVFLNVTGKKLKEQ